MFSTPEPRLLITGFGPFPGVVDNPTAKLARALDGARSGGWRLHGLVLPVSYRRAVADTVAAARALGAAAVLGSGVAVSRARPEVERRGRKPAGERPDVDGALPPPVIEGPDEVWSRWPLEDFASRLGAGLSDDAGDYVCNAWLYGVGHQLDCPVTFLHVPAAGVDPDHLRAALDGLLG